VVCNIHDPGERGLIVHSPFLRLLIRRSSLLAFLRYTHSPRRTVSCLIAGNAATHFTAGEAAAGAAGVAGVLRAGGIVAALAGAVGGATGAAAGTTAGAIGGATAAATFKLAFDFLSFNAAVRAICLARWAATHVVRLGCLNL
jgi:hypothetical protein